MNYTDELNKIAEKISPLETIKEDIKAAIQTAGGTPGESFLGLANDIYNIGISDTKVFVTDNTTTIAETKGYAGLMKRAEYLANCRMYIKNAIIARGVAVPGSTKFSEYPDLIKSISGTSQLPILSLSSAIGTVTGNTIITVNTGKISNKNNYRYTISDSLPVLNTNASTWKYWNGKDEITVNNESSLCIAETDANNLIVQAGIVIAKSKLRELLYNDLFIEMDKGEKLFATKVSRVSDKLSSTNKHYYAIDYKESFYSDDPIDKSIFKEYTIGDDIPLNKYNQYSTITIVETSKDDLVQRYGYSFAKIRNYADELIVSSIEGDNDWYTSISVLPSITSGNSYYYKEGQNVFADEEEIDITDNKFIKWNGSDQIIFGNNINDIPTSITIIEVNNNNQVQKSGYCNIKVKIPELKEIIITSTATDEPYGSMVIVNPEKEDGNRYFYKETTDIYNYSYEETINLSEYNLWDSTSDLYIKNGTRIVLVEVNSRDQLIGIGYTSIKSNVPVIQNLYLTSEYGSTTGSCHITIESEKDSSSNFYVYLVGNHAAIRYDDNLSKFTRYDFSKDIVGIQDKQLITIAEVDNQYLAKKVGTVCIKARPLELFALVITSWKSIKGGCTNLYITPLLTKGNKYKYAFTDQIPELYDDLSDWKDYTENMDLPAISGDTVCIAECDSNNKALKAGTCIVDAKDPDPVLGSITVDSVQGSESGYTKITIEQPLSDGYIYVYKITSTLPEYGDDLSDWNNWDGKSEIEANNGSIICVCEATNDKTAYKGGLATVYS